MPKNCWLQWAQSYRNIYFAPQRRRQVALNIMAFPTTRVLTGTARCGPALLGGIDKEENLAALQKNIDAALAKDNAK